MQHVLRLPLAVLMAVLLVSAPAAAQFMTAGEVFGVVTDDEGTPLENATVTLEAADRVTPFTATTNREGTYRLLNLPPGTYEMNVSRDGYYPVGPIDVVVNLGSTSRRDYQLPPVTAVEEVVTVRATAPQIETVKSGVSKYISGDSILQLPLANRTFLDVLLTLPGVDSGVAAGTLNARGPKNSFNVHGARSNQNNFLIDGAPNNDKSDLNFDDIAAVFVQAGPRTSAGAGAAGATFQVGTALQTFNIDAIEEVQVSTALFGAEFGSGSGAVVNVITRAGSDVFRGSATYNFQSDNYVRNPPQEFSRHQESFAFGGPITKGRTHFFTSYERDDHALGYDFNQPSAVVGRFLLGLDLTANKTERNRVTAKVSHVFSDANTATMTANYTGETADVMNSIFRTSVENLVPELHENNSIGLIGRDFHRFTGGAALESLVNVTLNGRTFDSGVDEPRRVRVVGPAIAATGTNSPDAENTLTSVYWSEKINWFSRNRSWKAGIGASWFEQETDQVAYYSILYGPSPVPTSADYYPETRLDPSVTDAFAFIQQDWFLSSRVTLNLGLRYAYDSMVRDHAFEPRVGVAYDPKGGGRSVLRAGGGIYHDRSNLIGVTGANRPPEFSANPITLEPIFSIPFPIRVDPALHLPATYKWLVGYERQLPWQLVGAAHLYGSHNRDLFYTDLLNRQRNDTQGSRPDPTVGTITLYTNSGESDVYDIEFELRRNFAPGTQLQVSYTYQDATGNSSFDFVSGNSPLNVVTFTEDAPQRSQVTGPLDYEVTHALKISGVASLPWDIIASGIMRWRSGHPFSIRELWLDPQFAGRFPEGYNSRRLDPFFNLDLRLGKAFRIGRHRIEGFFDLFNLTNRQNALEQDGVIRFNFSGPIGAPGTTENPNFLRVSARSAARSGQLGIRWTF